jgi:DNA-directed RNA polymerase subunit E'/Rpb7
MKLNQTVTLSPEEVNRMLTKFVEKKLAKKVVGSECGTDGSFTFKIEEQEVEDKKEG